MFDFLTARTAAKRPTPTPRRVTSFGRRLAAAVLPAVLIVGCSGTSGSPKTLPELEPNAFRAAAALACTSVINHRYYVSNYLADHDLVLDVLLIVRGEDVDSTPEQIAAAYGRLADEMRRSAEELAAVRAADAGDRQLWDRVIAAVRDRGAFYTTRQTLVAEERFDDIELGGVDGLDPDTLQQLELGDRDCTRV